MKVLSLVVYGSPFPGGPSRSRVHRIRLYLRTHNRLNRSHPRNRANCPPSPELKIPSGMGPSEKLTTPIVVGSLQQRPSFSF